MLDLSASVRRIVVSFAATIFAQWMFDACDTVWSQGLDQQLRRSSYSQLAAEAREGGDAQRGAVVFYQKFAACTRCHITDDTRQRLGPDLTRLESDVTDIHLVESVLEPSKVIRRGFETVEFELHDGSIVQGLIAAETPTHVTVRDVRNDFQEVTIALGEIDQRRKNDVSVMPAGLANGLTSRQQFLDLLRYLFEVREGGAARARALEPPPSAYAERPLPEYESQIDHAGMIRDLDTAAFERGQAIYNRLCINCHGTHDQPGSLPTSLRFASGKFKNGNDPYAMYMTLTRGFGMMVPQTWMVPSQKYDVVHYIREAHLKEFNASQYFVPTADYFASLPKGDSRGPEPSNILEWEQMDYGPNLILTLEIGDDGRNIAQKANAIRLDAGPGGVSQGRYWLAYDFDTMRVAGVWSGDQFCDWRGINFDGQHGQHPHVVGRVHVANPTGPGWANPADQSFIDQGRVIGRDGRPYGPLPRSWAKYRGMYYHGARTIVEYSVGDATVLEMPSVQVTHRAPIFLRTVNIGPRKSELKMQFAHRPGGELKFMDDADKARIMIARPQTLEPTDPDDIMVAGLMGTYGGVSWYAEEGEVRLRVPAGADPLQFTIWFGNVDEPNEAQQLADSIVIDDPALDLGPLTRGGPNRWPDELVTHVKLGDGSRPFAVDTLTYPVDNPWYCRMRLTGLDFLPDGDRMVVSDWDGNVWLVRGLKRLAAVPDDVRPEQFTEAIPLTWRRIASGLFQPLGILYRNGLIYVTCRDQLCVLHDLNGDDEIDWYESLNNDHQVTEHFHEFAMGLQADEAGNFYYAKSARHALPAVVPHHGTLLRVSADGSRTDILATGFRAANGVCLNPDGSFIVTDQEGHWNPKNRINYVRPGGFYGNMFGYHEVTDASDNAMEQPLCWITNEFDRSPGELLWVKSPKWQGLNGRLLNLSYGYGMVYVVPHEILDGQPQGGMCALPIERLPSGAMRGRFSPFDQQLYTCGMFAWAGNQTEPGGLFRIRATGVAPHLPVELRATRKGLRITFSDELDPASVRIADNFQIKAWSLKRTANYGSDHFNEHSLAVASARLAEDNRTVELTLPDITPTWCMEVRYQLRSTDGRTIEGRVHNTIHQLGE